MDADLWTRLRAIYLTKVWAAHCDVHHGGPTPSSTSIAAATLHSAILAMRTEFTAAYTAPSDLAQQCDAHMTGAQQRQSKGVKLEACGMDVLRCRCNVGCDFHQEEVHDRLWLAQQVLPGSHVRLAF